MSTAQAFVGLDSYQSFCGMIGHSAAMRAVFDRIALFARARIPVLIEGETGVGKDMVAQALRKCAGADGKYVALNCAAIPRELVESELFGHERGAFTGAVRRHVGILSEANGGTLFLDEIPGLPIPAQAKLLRALEAGEFRAVGGERVLRSEFRLIAASNENLHVAVAQGRFRLDLLHRLGAARVTVPPLRERRDDIQPLADMFLARFQATHDGQGPRTFSAAASRLLRFAPWPGNVRELRNVVEAAAAISCGHAIDEEDARDVMSITAGNGSNANASHRTLAEAVRLAEEHAIREALEIVNGNRDKAAELLGISVATLYRRLAACPNGTA